MLINLSNHPLSTWSAPQRDAAVALGHGPPADFPESMPIVPPEATTSEVATLADRVVDRAREFGAAAAHVAGEFTLTVALVQRLEAAGIPCYVATTARDVVEREDPAGGTRRESVFRFVAWRRYPTP